MENLFVTQQIINYCKANPNTLFDVELMFGNVFQCSDFDSFRKYVSRAKEPGDLYEVGKGVYYIGKNPTEEDIPVSYTHLRAHETPEHLVCRLLLEKKKKRTKPTTKSSKI